MGGPLGGIKKNEKQRKLLKNEILRRPITQLWVVTEHSRRWQMKGIAIYFFFFGHAMAPRGSAARRHARWGPEGPHRVQHSSGGPKGPIVYSTAAGARRAPSCTAHQRGPEGRVPLYRSKMKYPKLLFTGDGSLV